MKKVVIAVFILLITVVAPATFADGFMDSVEIHGFGGWAYGETDGFDYSVGNEDGNYDNASFNLNLTASPMEKLKINAQVEWKDGVNGSDTELDFAFAEWAFSDALKFRIGQIKSPFGIMRKYLMLELYDLFILFL